MRHTPGVPHLHGAVAALGMDAFVDVLPGSDLFGAVNAGRARIALGLEGDLCGFSDDQASTGTLTVVLGHQRGGYITRLQAAQAGEGAMNTRLGRVSGPICSGCKSFIAAPEVENQWCARYRGDWGKGGPGARLRAPQCVSCVPAAHSHNARRH